jgi:hypothetical protein
MRRFPFIFAGSVLLFACSAQCQSSAAPANAQSTNSASGSATATAVAAPATTAPAKKVWTNDDVGDLRADSTISTVGSTGTKPAHKTGTSARPRNPQQYQAQIARLEGQIPPLDTQIAQLQNAIDGKPTGDAKSSQRPRSVKADDWNVEMQDLQKKKQDILDHIAALKDQARHQGVAPNTLP